MKIKKHTHRTSGLYKFSLYYAIFFCLITNLALVGRIVGGENSYLEQSEYFFATILFQGILPLLAVVNIIVLGILFARGELEGRMKIFGILLFFVSMYLFLSLIISAY